MLIFENSQKTQKAPADHIRPTCWRTLLHMDCLQAVTMKLRNDRRHVKTLTQYLMTNQIAVSRLITDRHQSKDFHWIINFNNLLTQGLQHCL